MKRQIQTIPVIGIVLFCMQTAFAWKLENTTSITYDKDDKMPSMRTRELDFSDPMVNHAEKTVQIQEGRKRSDSQPDQQSSCLSQSLHTTSVSNSNPVIPPKMRILKPAFSKEEDDNGNIGYTFIGRIVYMSDIFEILTEEDFEFEGDIDPAVQKTLTIKADTFYCSEKTQPESPNYEIPGLADFVLIARSVIGTGCTIVLSHTLPMKKEFTAPRARDGSPGPPSHRGDNADSGARGTDGIMGTNIEIAQADGDGILRFRAAGASGTSGQNGGNGGSGGTGSAGAENREEVASCTFWTNKCPSDIWGAEGGRGGNGGNGGYGGISGRGGDSGSFLLYTPKSQSAGTGFEIELCPGEGGSPARNGNPGRGGSGGRGGCGTRYSKRWESYEGTNFCFCDERYGVNCASRGTSGQSGSVQGPDGRSSPVKGEKGTLRSIEERNLAEASQYYDENLLELMTREADDRYIRGDIKGAKKAYKDIKKVANTASQRPAKKYAKLMIKRIATKLNYIGHKSNYAPESQWTDIKIRLEAVLRDAKTQSDKINNILERIEMTNVLEDGFQNIQQSDIDIFKSKLQETQRLIDLQKALKRETIKKAREIEKIMQEYYDQFQTVLREAVDEQYRQSARNLANFLKLLLGLGVSVVSDPANLLTAPFELGLELDEIYRHQITPNCLQPIEQLNETALSRMKFTTQIKDRPVNMDFTKIDSKATASLLEAVNKDNSGTIILQYDCLIRMTGYRGTVLQSVVETYFDYGGLRIEMISQLIDIDINLRKLKLQQERQSATIQNLERSKEQSATKSYVKEPRLLIKSNLIQAFRATETIALENLFHLVAAYSKKDSATIQNLERSKEQSATKSYVKEPRLLIKSNLIQAFRATETIALENLFHLLAAYRFATLWEFDIFQSYSSILGDTQGTSNLFIFNGYQPLKGLSKELARQKCVYTKCITTRYNHQPDPASWQWEFNRERNPEMFRDLEEKEVVKFNITGKRICGRNNNNCLNTRLKKVYVELLGEEQHSNVRVIKMVLTHAGKNIFYMTGGREIIFEQEKLAKRQIRMTAGTSVGEDCSGGNTICEAPRLDTNFAHWIDMCTADPTTADDLMFGATPCRSPFGDYFLEVPKRKKGSSSLLKNDKKLDLTKINKIRFYAQLQLWIDYPTQGVSQCQAISCGERELQIEFPDEASSAADGGK